MLILVAAIAIPIIFKDDIKAALDKELAKAVNADILFDVDDLSLSLFTNFPNLTVEVQNFGVVNRAPFEGNQLLGVESLEVEVNLKSVLIDDDMRLKGLSLNRPQIHISVLKDGTANYDIAIATEDSVVVEEVSSPSSEFAFAIDHWAINNAKIVYDDQTLPFKLELKNLTHTGSGTFSDVLFDLTTKTIVDTVNVVFDGTKYISNKRLDIDLILAISDNYAKYTFKENTIRLNDFALGFDGYLALLEEGFDMDLTYASKDNSFKSLLSLVPSTYLEGFEAVKTAGSLSFGGAVKGLFNDNGLPAFNLNLEVGDAMFQYPDLPTAATDINIKTSINNTDGVIDHTTVDVSQFHINLGGNPFDATLKVSNLNDVKWDLKVKGEINLTSVSEIMPMEGTTLEGLINMDMQSNGKLSLVETEQYDQLTTAGTMKVSNMKYIDDAFAYNIDIHNVDASFDPEKIELSAFDAVIGKSDMQMNGEISNYIAYVLDSNQVLKGHVNFSSTLLDLDEFISEEEVSEEAPTETVAEDTTSLSTVSIPENINFILNSKIGTVKMMDMTLTKVAGDVITKDGVANLSDLKFNTLDGQFVANGSYNAKDTNNPAYDFDLAVKNLSIRQAFETFTIVKEYVPLAKKMTGDVSTDFNISGLLKQDMMPNFESINAKFLLNIAQAALDKPKFMTDLGNVTKLGNKLGGSNDKISLNDVKISATIINGELNVKPFDIKMGNYKTNFSGKCTVDGKLDYKINMEIPAGNIGTQVNSFLSKYTGSSNTSSIIKLPIGIGGTYDAPTYSLLGGPKHQAKAVVGAIKDKVKEVVKENFDAEKEKQRQKILAEAQKQADNLTAEGKKVADEIRKEGYAQADNLVKEAGSNFIKKKIAQEAAKKLKAVTDKKAQKVEDESKKKADKLLAKAQSKVAAIK